MCPDRGVLVVQEEGGIGLVFVVDEGDDGVGKVKKAFDALGEKEEEVVPVPDAGDVVAEVQ
jgi:hypothetical protein